MADTANKSGSENTFNKSDKTKDVRSTNIQAAKGNPSSIQPSLTALEPV